jgi:hypothetical protein
MTDPAAQLVVDALGKSGCAICRAIANDEARWMEAYWRDAMFDSEARMRFFNGGGFCKHHAWLLHRQAKRVGYGAAVSYLYGNLVRRDLDLVRSLKRKRRPRLRRSEPCRACVVSKGIARRKVEFLVEELERPETRKRYEKSDGLCFPHLAAALERARKREVTDLLLADWEGRLGSLRERLTEYDRKRDHRFAHEPKGEEQRSWTDVVEHYVGKPTL